MALRCNTGEPDAKTCWLVLFCANELLEAIGEPAGTVCDPVGATCEPAGTTGDPASTIDENEDVAGETRLDHEEGSWS